MKILVAKINSVVDTEVKEKIKNDILTGVDKGLIVCDPFVELSVIEVDEIDLSVESPLRMGESNGKSN